MKKQIGIAAVVLAFTVTSCLAGAGVFGVYQDLGDLDDSGYGIGFKVEGNLAPQVSIDGRVSYVTGPTVGSWWDEEDLTIIPIEVNVNWIIPLMVCTPYLGAGIGYYHFDPDWIDGEVGYNLHGGVKIDTGRSAQPFAEIRHLTLEPNDSDFGGIGIIAGLSWGMW